ncbi:MAG: hypothetical protein P4L26_11940 [Terracidiphilus sp.]|nr:hypothetical protein [Terracidiphilus sp.]
MRDLILQCRCSSEGAKEFEQRVDNRERRNHHAYPEGGSEYQDAQGTDRGDDSEDLLEELCQDVTQAFQDGRKDEEPGRFASRLILWRKRSQDLCDLLLPFFMAEPALDF